MNDCQRQVAPVVRAVEKRYDTLKYRLYYLLGGPGPIKIVPYRGYGTHQKLYLQGRVLEERGITPPSETDSWWDNLVNMYKRIQSRQVPHARLSARFQDVAYEVTADEEGMFELWIDARRPVADNQIWQPVQLELVEPLSDQQEGPVRAMGQVLIPPRSARFGVISDIDDTVIQSDVGSFLQMLGTVLLSNARTRLPLPGVAAFYRALHAGHHSEAKNPMFYVSNGLWNLYDLLEDAFQLNEIPGGPVLLCETGGFIETRFCRRASASISWG
jgi:phosphatidate phosphatase APP1